MYGEHGSGGTGSDSRRWVTGAAAGDAAIRLFCFPHAGGGAGFFRSWCALLAPGIDVRPIQLPGRETRIGEPPLRRVEQVLEPLCSGMGPYLDRPYALFGHSMGALLAYETARRLSDGGRPGPMCLIVSGRRAPGRTANRPPLSALPDDEFVARVARLNGIPQEVLDEPDLVSMILPALRADYELAETYRRLAGNRLSCPVVAYAATDDPEVEPAGVHAWQEETSGRFMVREYAGDHFYLKGNRPDVMRAIRADLHAALRDAPALIRW